MSKELSKKFIVFLLFTVGAICTGRLQAQVIVIAHPDVKSSEIMKDDLREVFSGNAVALKDGSRVAPVLLKSGSVNDEFLKAYIGKTDFAYRAAWRSLVFAGQATMPKTLDGDAAVVDFVSHNPHAIAYISKASPHEGVKVLTVR